jgi:inner membrane transporter RhtA
MVLGSCTSLQVGAALATQLFPRIGSAGVTLLRLSIAAAVLVLATRPRSRGWDRTQWKAVIGFGMSLAAMNGSFYAALARIPLGPAVTIEFLGPLVLAAVLSRRLRDLTWVVLAAAGVTLLGVAGEGGVHGLDVVGVAFALVAGGFWALYILASARAGAAVPGQAGLAVALVVAALLLLPVGIGGAIDAIAHPRLLPLAVGTGLLASVIPYSLELSALRRLPAGVFGILLSLEPAIATVAGWLLLSQGLDALQAIAVSAVVIASAASTVSTRRSTKATTTSSAGERDRPPQAAQRGG